MGASNVAVATEYVLLSVLGRGGMAEVHLALRLGRGAPRPIALKRARPDQDASEKSASESALVSEALISARLLHPNIVTVVDLASWNGETVVELEYVEGASLTQLLHWASARGQRLPEDVLFRIMSDVLAALDHAHTARGIGGRLAPIVHRDVSPSNILIGLDGHVRLIDFGVAKAPSLSAETPVGTVKGKLRYMAPEQLSGDAGLDGRADLFSCGVILWEALSGRNLHNASCAYSLVLGATARRLSSKIAVSRRVDEMVARCLEREPDRRFPSALALQAALRDCAREGIGFASSAKLASLVREAQGAKIAARRALIETKLAELGVRRRSVLSLTQRATAVALGAAVSALAGAALSLLR